MMATVTVLALVTYLITTSMTTACCPMQGPITRPRSLLDAMQLLEGKGMGRLEKGRVAEHVLAA